VDTIERLEEQRTAKVEFVTEMLAAVETDGRDLSEVESRNLDAARDRIAELDAQLEPLRQFEELRAAAAPVVKATSRPATRTQPRDADQPADVLLRSPEWQSWSGIGTSPRIEIPNLLTRALPHTTAAFGLDAGTPLGGIYGNDTVHTPIMDSLNRVTVTGTTANYVTYTVTDGTDTVAEGSVKPDLEVVPTPVADVIPKVANHTAATRELLEDSAAVRSLLDGEMRRGVARKLEESAGSVIDNAAWGNTVNADMLTAIRIAKGEVDARGFMADTLFINPADLAALDISVMTTAGLGAVTQNAYFGLRVVPSGSITAGTTVVADAASAVTHFSREGIVVFATDSHSTNFVANVLDFVCEARALTAVIRTAAGQSTSAA
jgi:hypothetical protein